MRFITITINILTSFLIIGFAILDLLSLSYSDFRSLVTAVQLLAEIAIGLLAVSIATRVCDGLWRRLALVLLLPMGLQRAWYLWLFRNEDLPWDYFILVAAPPFILLAALYALPRRKVPFVEDSLQNDATAQRLIWMLLRVAVALLASVVFLFSSFNFCTGMDILGSGLPSLATSLIAIGGSISALVYALAPLAMHRRTITINLVAIVLALRTARGVVEYQYLLRLDLSGWIIVCIDFVPTAAILLVAMAYPSFSALKVIEESTMDLE